MHSSATGYHHSMLLSSHLRRRSKVLGWLCTVNKGNAQERNTFYPFRSTISPAIALMEIVPIIRLSSFLLTKTAFLTYK